MHFVHDCCTKTVLSGVATFSVAMCHFVIVINFKTLPGLLSMQMYDARTGMYWYLQLAIHLLNLSILSLENDAASPFQICAVVLPKLVSLQYLHT